MSLIIVLFYSYCHLVGHRNECCVEISGTPMDRVVYALISRSKEDWRAHQWVADQKEKVYPIFLELLKDPKPIDDAIARRLGEMHPAIKYSAYASIFAYVKNQKADRSQFIQPALENLRNDHGDLRMYTFELLDEIGRERDSVPFVAMLEQSDPCEAGKTAYFLEKRGGRNELLALDIWIRAYKTKCAEQRMKFPDFVAKYRDRLQARLDKADSLKAPGKPAFPPNDETATPTPRVLAALRADPDGKNDDRRWLSGLKEQAFPSLYQLLADPKTKPSDVRAILHHVKATDGARGAFVPKALACLTQGDVDVRLAALGLLQVIGSKSDTSPIVALLWDERQLVVDLACETLASIGGENDLIAIDIWLDYLTKKHVETEVPGRAFYLQQRALLKSRIEKANATLKGQGK